MTKVPRVFFSYVRQVDVHDQRRLTMLRERLQGELQVLTGEPVEIFQDIADIGWGENWRKRLEETLDESLFLLPVLTEGYFKSPTCREEFEVFAAREQALARDDLILPLLYTPCPSMHRRRSDTMVAIINARNYEDWTKTRHEDPTKPDYNRAITRLAERIIEAIDRHDASIVERTAERGTVTTETNAEANRNVVEARVGSNNEALSKLAAQSEDEYLFDLANSGDQDAMITVGLMCERGTRVEQDHEKAVQWYRKAADAGSSQGMFNLGFMCDQGQGVEQDYEKAAQWYRKAADAGNRTAMFNLGVMYGQGQGVEQDYEKKIQWYRKAADAGECTAMFSLGVMYRQGQGVEQDYEKAVEWYRKAVDAGDHTAMFSLGIMYERGQGVEHDDEKAAQWYHKAADAGSSDAMHALGWMYAQGRGIEQDYEKAVEWYRKAADAGSADGMCSLGASYNDGVGVSRNARKAVSWYRLGAKAGSSQAMRNLAWHFAHGRGVAQDYESAVIWYRKATDERHKDARWELLWLQCGHYATLTLGALILLSLAAGIVASIVN